MDPIPALRRISYRGGLDPNYETLRRLQKAFLLAVPFENFDIHLGREIKLDPGAIVEKIIGKGRGGFCYECNVVFRELLTALRFRADCISARMVAPDGQVGAESGHMALIVHLDSGVYLADVGNGRSTREPLPLDGSFQSVAEGITYRVGDNPGGDFALYFRPADAEWKPRFLFASQPRRLEEFADMCRFHQTSPESFFTQTRLATLATVSGRITLMENRLTITRMNGTVKEERDLPMNKECIEALRNVFEIDIPYYPPAKCPSAGAVKGG